MKVSAVSSSIYRIAKNSSPPILPTWFGSDISVFKSVENPDNLSWLHIDLNSSKITQECLNFFYDKIENNGVILFDDYAHIHFEDTRKIIDEFLFNKEGNFLHFPTGQAFFIKTK